MVALWCALRADRGRWWLAGTGLAAGLGGLDRGHRALPAGPGPGLAAAGARPGPAPVGGAGRRVPARGAAAARFAGRAPGACRCRENPAESSTVLDRLGHLFGPVLRQYVGVTYSHTEGGLWVPLQVLVVAGLVAAYLVAVVRRRWAGRLPARAGRPAGARPTCCSPSRRWWRCSTRPRTPPGTPAPRATWSARSRCWRSGWPRWCRPGRGRCRRPAVAAAAALSLAFFPTIQSRDTSARYATLRQVAAQLAADGEDRVWAGYWTATPLQYAAGDRLTVATAGGVRRFPAAQAAVERAPRFVYVGSDRTGPRPRSAPRSTAGTCRTAAPGRSPS